MEKPTQEDLDTTHRTLLALVKITEEEEPEAFNYITLLEEVMSQIPVYVKDV